VSTESFLDRHYHLLRRLHSLSGVVPIGIFLFPHLLTNSSIVWGQWLMAGKYAEYGHAGVVTFQHEVNFIHSLPFLPILEWAVLFIPIAFHAILGVWFATSGKHNVERYGYQDNWRYTFQRLSGYIAIVFIFMHVTSLRFQWTYGGLMGPFYPDAASSSTAIHFQEGPLADLYIIHAFYAIGVLSIVFHFANGLWTAAITWGLTISEQAQRRWGGVCAAVGVFLAVAGVAAIVGFSVVDVDEALETEMRMRGEDPEFAPELTLVPGEAGVESQTFAGAVTAP
jgi:succinate dehydrogenase / fumarate reductase cytochrome b subunit